MKTLSIPCFATLGLALGFGAIPAAASTSGFDFAECSNSSNYYGVAQTENSTCASSGYSNTSGSLSMTIGSGASAVTVTATAYVTTTNSGAVGTAMESTSGSNTYAAVGQYTGYGLGVCSVSTDGSPYSSGYSDTNPSNGCNAPYHQVNDVNGIEFILFTFSTPVNLSSITLANFGGDPDNLNEMGFTYWVDPNSLTAISAGGTTVLCGTDSAPTCPTSEGSGGGIGSGSWTTGFGANGQGSLSDVTTLLVAADTSESDDFFKVQGLGGIVRATPEPATFGVFGISLVGLGLYRRGRKKSS